MQVQLPRYRLRKPEFIIIQHGIQIQLIHRRSKTHIHHIARNSFDLPHDQLRNRPRPRQRFEHANGKGESVATRIRHLTRFDGAGGQLDDGAEDQRADEERRVFDHGLADGG